jgi:hypothetical protein
VFEGDLHRADRAGTPAWWARDAAGALWPADGEHDLTVLMPGRPMVAAGQHVHLRITAGRVHLFDDDSEKRINISVVEGSAI